MSESEMAELVAAIDAISGDDPETAHSMLDDYLVALMPPEVVEAIHRLYGRCRWWACA